MHKYTQHADPGRNAGERFEKVRAADHACVRAYVRVRARLKGPQMRAKWAAR